LISPELADVLSEIICRIRGQDGTVPLVTAYDYHERVWNPPMPLLFQRRYGGEHHAIGGPAVRELISDALASTGMTDASGKPLRFVPHDFRRIFITDAKMSRIASDASFASLREHALPAAQRAALRCARPGGPPRGYGDLRLHGPLGSDATTMQLIPLRSVHHRCARWHRDASGSSRLHRVHHRRPGLRCRAGTAAARDALGLVTSRT
jgi:hypothetical protein